MDRYQEIANELYESERTGTPIPQISARYVLTIAEAYQVQLMNRDRWLKDGAKIIGKKIGLTSKAMQQSLGVDTPDFGFLYDTRQSFDGKIPRKKLLQPRVEGELAFVLKEDLPPGATLKEVLSATEYVLPAIEIVDSHIADWKLRIQDTVADNASCGMFRLGEHRIRPDVDLASLRMTLYKNGQPVNSDTAAAVMGHPAHAVVWLADALSDYDVTLNAGDIILSGAITEAVAAVPGDHFTADFCPYGSVSVRFEE